MLQQSHNLWFKTKQWFILTEELVCGEAMVAGVVCCYVTRLSLSVCIPEMAPRASHSSGTSRSDRAWLSHSDGGIVRVPGQRHKYISSYRLKSFCKYQIVPNNSLRWAQSGGWGSTCHLWWAYCKMHSKGLWQQGRWIIGPNLGNVSLQQAENPVSLTRIWGCQILVREILWVPYVSIFFESSPTSEFVFHPWEELMFPQLCSPSSQES